MHVLTVNEHLLETAKARAIADTSPRPQSPLRDATYPERPQRALGSVAEMKAPSDDEIFDSA